MLIRRNKSLIREIPVDDDDDNNNNNNKYFREINNVAMRIDSCDDWWQIIFEWALMAVNIHINIPKGLSSPSNIAINLL